jgi:hypothetical protein
MPYLLSERLGACPLMQGLLRLELPMRPRSSSLATIILAIHNAHYNTM